MGITIPESNHSHKRKQAGSDNASVTGAVIIGLLLLGYLWLSGTAGAATVESQSAQTIVEQTDYWR